MEKDEKKQINAEEKQDMPVADENPQESVKVVYEAAIHEQEETQSGESDSDTASDCTEVSLLKPKKEFKFVKPIDELYDENIVAPVEITEQGKHEELIEDSEKENSEAEDPESEDSDNQKKKKNKEVKTKRKGCLHAILYTAIILVVAGLISAFAISALLDMTAVGKPDKKVDVPIAKSSSVITIADKLKSAGVINNPISFRLYVKVKHISGFQYGTYTLNSDMGYAEIISNLQKSATARATVKVMIPEGKTIQWIDKQLANNKVCDAGEFINACNAGNLKMTFDPQIVTKDRLYKYEGYMFPDTYEFYAGSTGKAAAQKMLDGFSAKFDSTMQAKATAMGMTVDQVITLASIIQSETGNVQQMSHVSSVFHNRLTNGVAAAGGKKLLQSDATIYYTTKDITPVLQQSATEVASAYNTYTHEGLTPGPICNPGLDAIRAALYPSNTSDYYFVTDNAGNYYYAQTYSAHANNVNKALRNNSQAAGTDVYK